jgi:peptidoglycan/xylan/chitin deacetylase (PgdA/CDA1 family)
MKFAAININLDSFGSTYGFPKDYRDPTFSSIMDRFLKIADKWGFKYSIYVIGKDLENVENRKAVLSWSEMGHEIGNHSWSHLNNLGSLSYEQLFDEVKRSHDIISDVIGKEPCGFIAPGWSTSKQLIEILMDLSYEYDTSTWPSLLMYPALVKYMTILVGDSKISTILDRKDLLYPFIARRDAHVIGNNSHSIVSLPLPTNKWRISCWHTTAFMLGWKLHSRLLRSCLDEIDSFYYLVHPADLATQEDINYSEKIRVERMQYSLSEKDDLFENALGEIVNSGRKLVTMRELCNNYKMEHINALVER